MGTERETSPAEPEPATPEIRVSSPARATPRAPTARLGNVAPQARLAVGPAGDPELERVQPAPSRIGESDVQRRTSRVQPVTRISTIDILPAATPRVAQRMEQAGAKAAPTVEAEIPPEWAAENLKMDEMFATMLDVHSAWLDESTQGIKYAVVDKMALAARYVEKAMWNTDDEGPFDPNKEACKKAITNVAEGHCPDALTLPSAADPRRTILLNREKYDASGGASAPASDDYTAVNSVLMHEAHHAKSVGFLNPWFFPGEQGLSWKFDECVTEFFAKKAWDVANPSDMDGYSQGSNYFSDPKKKTGWYGDAVVEMVAQGLFTNDDLGKAYFKGDADSLTALRAKSKEVTAIVEKTTAQMPQHN